MTRKYTVLTGLLVAYGVTAAWLSTPTAQPQYRILGTVALRSLANGKFVVAENAGKEPLIANREVPQVWETFQVISMEDVVVPTPTPTPAPVDPGPTPMPTAAYVAAIKQQLVAQGSDLSGACGAFAITKRVAWGLRVQGAGLLSKPSGNNCEGYATDIVVYALDNRAFDVLGDGGNANVPDWRPTDVDDLVARARPAVQP